MIRILLAVCFFGVLGQGQDTKPLIKKVTNIDGVEKTLSQGDEVRVFGTEFCLARTQVPLPIDQTAINPSSWGCRVRIGKKLAQMSFAFTSYIYGSSEMKFTVPSDSEGGTVQVSVERFDIKDGEVVVLATSDPFPVQIQSSDSPTVKGKKGGKKKK